MEFKGSFLLNTSLGHYAVPFIDASDLSDYPTTKELRDLLNAETVTTSILAINWQNKHYTVSSPVELTDIGITLNKSVALWQCTPSSGTFFSSGGTNIFYGIGYTFLLLDYTNRYRFNTFTAVAYEETHNFDNIAVSFPDTNNLGSMVVSPNNIYWTHGDDFSREAATLVNDYFHNNPPNPHKPNSDPYAKDPDGESGTGGGTGSFDGKGDNIDIPSLPALSSADTGFITLFNPTIAQLKELASYMWDGSLFDLNTWQKLFANPMDAILGLSIVPVAVPKGGEGAVKVGNISTGVSMTKASSQYVVVDCGTINVNEYWGAYLDYEPYTKAEIYLPYCGIHQIATDDIMGKAVHVVYHVDILSGACCAYVKCGGSVLYSFIGQCASSIPISGTDFTNVINGVISAAVSVGSMVATGGASAPLAVPSLAQTAVNSMKPSIEKSGAMGGTGGMLAMQTPYLILTRPRQALPSRQNTFTGYPSFITEKLSDLSGYTEIEEIHLENISATESELSEIENLLKSGVIF